MSNDRLALFPDELSIRTEDEIVGQRREGPPAPVIDTAKHANIAVRLVVPTHLNVDLILCAALPRRLQLPRLTDFAR